MQNLKSITLFFVIFHLLSHAAQSQQRLPIPGQPANRPGMLAMLKDGSTAAFVRFSRPKVTHGLAMVNPEGSTYASDVFQGFEGVFPGPDSKSGRLYFQAARDQLISVTGTFFITVQYFDQGQGALELEYLYHTNPATVSASTDRIFLGNSRQWNQHSFVMAGAQLDQSYEGGTDFALRSSGVPIRMVALTRTPIGNTQNEVSPQFSQPLATLPAGFQFALYPDDEPNGGLWVNVERAKEKARLYSAWGTPMVIDTLTSAAATSPQDQVDFRSFSKRAQHLSSYNLTWTPRVEVGHVRALPPELQQNLQFAFGSDRNQEGPMLSLWEPRLIDIYSTLFNTLRQGVLNSQMRTMILAFGGAWGPLMHSGTGWPDIWAGDPLALQAFQNHIRQRYNSLEGLSRAWRIPVSSWNEAIPKLNDADSPQKRLDICTWYQTAFLNVIDQITQAARRSFPQVQMVIEIGDNYQYGAVDPRGLAQIAAKNGSSIVMANQTPVQSRSFMWQLLSFHCRQNNVPFGLRFFQDASVENLLGAFFSLVSEGGSLFFYNESQMAAHGVWEEYLQSIDRLRVTQPRRQVAVVFPRSSVNAYKPTEFERIIQQMRELFAFDLVDEYDLNTINAAQYPLVFSPWGDIWTTNAIQNFERLARAGAAVIVHTQGPWRTITGDMRFNEALFAAQAVQQGQQWVLEPRTRDTNIRDNNRRAAVPNRRVVELNGNTDMPFISGEWSSPQASDAAKRYGFEFNRFRFMGERGQLRFPLAPSSNYDLIVEGFIPKGQEVQVTVNDRPVGQIQGQGNTTWISPLEVRNQNVSIQFSGRTWAAGEVLGATQTFRPSMAVSRVAVLPRGERLAQIQESPSSRQALEADFRRQALRGSWMRELGRGVTVIAPENYVSEFVYMELVNAVVMNPRLLDPQYNLRLPPDGELNNVYVSPHVGTNIYLNVNQQSVSLQTQGDRPRAYTIPPMQITYME